MVLEKPEPLPHYVGKVPLLRCFRELQKEEKAPFNSSGRGNWRGSAKEGGLVV